MNASSVIAAPEFQHRVPDYAVVVEYKLCENCGHNFKRCAESRRELCCTCQAMLKTRNNQVWMSICCGAARSWGEGRPEDTRGKLLRCVSCGEKAQPHEFFQVA